MTETRPIGADIGSETIPQLQARWLHAGLQARLLGNVALALLAVLLLDPGPHAHETRIWFGAVLLLSLWRWQQSVAYERASHAAVVDAAAWLGRLRAGVAASGLLWGLAVWLFFPVEHVRQELFTLMLVLVTVGAASALVLDLRSLVLFASPIMIALTVRLLQFGGPVGVEIVMMLAALALFVLANVRRAGLMVLEVARLRHELARRGDEVTEFGERLESLLQAGPLVLYVRLADGEHDFSYVSQSAERVFGYPASSWLGSASSWADRIHPDDRERAEELLQRAGEREHVCEYRLRHADGCYRWIRDTLRRVHREPDSELMGAWLDIDEQRRAERRQHETHRLLDEVVRHVPAVVFMRRAKPPACFELFNVEAEQLFGVPAEAALGRTANEVLTPAHAGALSAIDRDLLDDADRVDMTVAFVDRDGSPSTLQTSTLLLRDAAGEAEHVLSVGIDITEHCEIERELAQRRDADELVAELLAEFIAQPDDWGLYPRALRRLLDLTDSGCGFAVALDADGGAAPCCLALLGNVPLGEPGTGDPMAGLLPLLELAGRRDCSTLGDIAHALPSGHHLSSFVALRGYSARALKLIVGLANRPDGYPRELLDLLRPVTAALGLIAGAQRERKRERAAQAEIARLSLVARATDNGVIITDASGVAEWVNCAFERMSGYMLDQIRGRRPSELLRGAESDPATAAFIDGEVRRRAPFEVEMINYHRSGARYWARINGSPLFDAAGHFGGYIAICSDVTKRREQDAALQELLARLQKIAGHMPGGIFQLARDRTGRLSMAYASSGLAALLHLPHGCVRHSVRSLFRLVHGADRALVAQSIDESAALMQAWECEFRVHDTAGRARWLLARAMPEADGNGGLLWHGVVTDITERHQQELHRVERAILFQTILDGVDDAIVTVDASRRIVSANRAAVQLFGHAEHELVGCDLARLLPLAGRGQGGLDAEVGQAPSHRTGLARSGAQLPLEVRVSQAWRDGNPLHVLVARDLSEVRRVQRLETEFVSMVSHELRTPLTSITGALGLIDAGAYGPLPEEMRGILEIAGRNCRRLSTLVNDLLDVERLRSGRQRVQPALQRLRPLLEQALETVASLADGAAMRMRLEAADADAEVWADPVRLQQVLVNLLSNAIKFSPPGGLVRLRAERRPGGVKVSIVDEGPGIPAEFRDRVFQRFARADSSDARQVGGTGLGLAICRELVERMHGWIGFDSPPSCGATFWVVLPAQAPEATAGRFQVPVAAPGPRVLLLDADEAAASGIEQCLQLIGMAVERCGSAEAARAAAAAGPYCGVVVDPLLPDEPGARVLDELAERCREWNAALLVYSAFADEARRNCVVDAGAWLHKPQQCDRMLGLLAAQSGHSAASELPPSATTLRAKENA